MPAVSTKELPTASFQVVPSAEVCHRMVGTPSKRGDTETVAPRVAVVPVVAEMLPGWSGTTGVGAQGWTVCVLAGDVLARYATEGSSVLRKVAERLGAPTGRALVVHVATPLAPTGTVASSVAPRRISTLPSPTGWLVPTVTVRVVIVTDRPSYDGLGVLETVVAVSKTGAAIGTALMAPAVSEIFVTLGSM
jgi:hypothetical protein